MRFSLQRTCLLLAAGALGPTNGCSDVLGIDEPRGRCDGASCSSGGNSDSNIDASLDSGGDISSGGSAGQPEIMADASLADSADGASAPLDASDHPDLHDGSEALDSRDTEAPDAGFDAFSEADADDASKPACAQGEVTCDRYQPLKCESGNWVTAGPECLDYCQDGSCREAPPSCHAPSAADPCVDGVSCCDTIWIPGGTYQMGQVDEESPDQSYERTVSGFYLDRFEVTVGRFASFVSRYKIPEEGAGQHPRVPGSGWKSSWKELVSPIGFTDSYEETVPPTAEALRAQISDPDHCANSTFATERRTLPINCVNWYVAFAFCADDGGRLPTEAEWNYAAAHGADARPYPWSSSVSDTAVDPSRAAYFIDGEPILELPTEVGSHAAGRGGYSRNLGQGHDDLAGNVFEWVADAWQEYPPKTCAADCMAAWNEADSSRVVRGGGFLYNSSALRTGNRLPSEADRNSVQFGFRCARDISTR